MAFSAEELEALPAQKGREIEVLQSIPAYQLDSLLLEKSYRLKPESASPKAYELLRRTLWETDALAVVRFAWRCKTRLAVLRVRSNAIVLQAFRRANELRDGCPASGPDRGDRGADLLHNAHGLVFQDITGVPGRAQPVSTCAVCSRTGSCLSPLFFVPRRAPVLANPNLPHTRPVFKRRCSGMCREPRSHGLQGVPGVIEPGTCKQAGRRLDGCTRLPTVRQKGTTTQRSRGTAHG